MDFVNVKKLRTAPLKTLDSFIFNHTSLLHSSFTATVDVRRIVSSLAINQADTQIAVVETDGPTDDSIESAVVRIYDIGMIRQEDDEAVYIYIIIYSNCPKPVIQSDHLISDDYYYYYY